MKQLTIASEDRVARRQLILTIQRYYSSTRFGPYLVKLDLVEDLAMKTMPEMSQLLAEIKFAIQNKTTGDLFQRAVPQLIRCAEPLVSTFYNVRGLGAALTHSESFKDLLEEAMLENQVFTNTPATTRLTLEVLKTAFVVGEVNRHLDAQKLAAKEKEVKVSKETADLMA